MLQGKFIKVLNHIILIALFITLISCKDKQYKDKTNEVSPISITLLGISFELNKFTYSETDSIDPWYYPYEIVFLYEISNNSSKEITFITNDTLENAVNYYQGIIRYKDIPVQCDETIKVKKEKSRMFNCYIMNLPIFDSIYNRKEFNVFITNFKDNLNNKANIINKDRKISSAEKNLSFYFHESFYYRFNHWRDKNIKLEKIGYPEKAVPDTIQIIKPSRGVEW
ncbi:MAG: hypothetical protein K9H84_08630 [Bacteroidales bacterium]|nr:hypothetical protein [Bacteroidales bacterium]